MNSRQKYNLSQAVEKLKRENTNKGLDYEILTKKRKTKWDNTDILLKVDGNTSILSLSVGDLRTIGSIYEVLKRFA